MTHLPGYYTASELANHLRMSRQNLYQSGLMDALKSYKVGAVRLYPKMDVDGIFHWLYVRRGLIALGHLEEKSPLVDKGMMARANEENEFTYECPMCGGFAVSNPDEDIPRYWCEKDGFITPAGYGERAWDVTRAVTRADGMHEHEEVKP